MKFLAKFAAVCVLYLVAAQTVRLEADDTLEQRDAVPAYDFATGTPLLIEASQDTAGDDCSNGACASGACGSLGEGRPVRHALAAPFRRWRPLKLAGVGLRATGRWILRR